MTCTHNRTTCLTPNLTLSLLLNLPKGHITAREIMGAFVKGVAVMH